MRQPSAQNVLQRMNSFHVVRVGLTLCHQQGFNASAEPNVRKECMLCIVDIQQKVGADAVSPYIRDLTVNKVGQFISENRAFVLLLILAILLAFLSAFLHLKNQKSSG